MWDIRYYKLAKHVSTWSKDPRKQVGAVITEDNYIRGLGFNGFPRGIEDSFNRLQDKRIKLQLMIHAEINALRAAKGLGDTIYIYPCLPCITCALQIIQVGIKKIITSSNKPNTSWNPTFVHEILTEAGIEIKIIEVHDE